MSQSSKNISLSFHLSPHVLHIVNQSHQDSLSSSSFSYCTHHSHTLQMHNVIHTITQLWSKLDESIPTWILFEQPPALPNNECDHHYIDVWFYMKMIFKTKHVRLYSLLANGIFSRVNPRDLGKLTTLHFIIYTIFSSPSENLHFFLPTILRFSMIDFDTSNATPTLVITKLLMKHAPAMSETCR